MSSGDDYNRNEIVYAIGAFSIPGQRFFLTVRVTKRQEAFGLTFSK